MADVLNVTQRPQLGSRSSRRLRRSGQVPAVLYGHGKENVNLTIPAGELYHAVRYGSKLVEVRGAVQDSALIRDVQWDAYGQEVLHVDLARVSAEEAVEITLAVELRGEAPGSREGGVIDHSTHEIEIRCPAKAIPENFVVNINSLHLGESITASDLPLPEGAELLTDPDQVIVSCEEPVAEIEEEVAAAEAEPEVIGRKEEGEEEANE